MLLLLEGRCILGPQHYNSAVQKITPSTLTNSSRGSYSMTSCAIGRHSP
jgi:hypothetical protein